MADGYGNIYPDSYGFDEKQNETARMDTLKLILYDLNSAISPHELRLQAIQGALEEFDHNDEQLHDEELELRADHILLQKLTYAMSINPSADEVGYITSALEAVYRGSRTRLGQSFHEICDALMPLFVDMIRPPAGWTPQQLSVLLNEQNENDMMGMGGGDSEKARDLRMRGSVYSGVGDERSVAMSLGGASRFSNDPSINRGHQGTNEDFNYSYQSFHNGHPTYYGDYDEESAESVEIPTEPINDEEETFVPNVPAETAEYFNEMNNRRSSIETGGTVGTGGESKAESKADSMGNTSALVLDKRMSSFGVETDTTGNDQALVLHDNVVGGGAPGGGGNARMIGNKLRESGVIRNELADAQQMLRRMSSVASNEEPEVPAVLSQSPDQSQISHNSYDEFLRKEKEKMEAAAAVDDESEPGLHSNSGGGSQEDEENKPVHPTFAPPQVQYNDEEEYEVQEAPQDQYGEPPKVQYEGGEYEGQDRFGEPPKVQYDSHDEGDYEDGRGYEEEEEKNDQSAHPTWDPPQVQYDDEGEFEDGEYEEERYENNGHGLRYEGQDQYDHEEEAYGEGEGDEAMDIRGGGGDDEIEDVTDQYASASVAGGISVAESHDNPFAEEGQNFDEYGGYSGEAPQVFSGYDDPHQQGQNYDRKYSETSGASGYTDNEPIRRLSVLSDDWGGVDRSDRDQSTMGGGQSYGSSAMGGGQSYGGASGLETMPESEYNLPPSEQDNPASYHVGEDDLPSINPFTIVGDEETEAEEKYSDYPDDNPAHEPMGSQQDYNEEDIFQFQEPTRPKSKQDYFNYSDPMQGEVCALAVRKVIKILRYFSRVLSAMEPLAQQGGFVDALLYHMTKKPLSTDYEDEIATRVDAIAVLVNLACAEENKIMLVYHPGLLDAVINIANHDPIDEAREHAAIVLMNLAYAEENKIHMVNQDQLLDTLVHLLSDVSPFTRRYASAALFTLACTYANTSVMTKHCDGGILEALRKVLLNDPIDEARVNAAEALFNMARNNSDDTVENMGNHPRLLASLSHSVLSDYSADVRAYSARALEWLSADIHHPMPCHRVLLKALTLASQWTKTTCIAEALKMQASLAENRVPLATHPGLLDALASLALMDGIQDEEVKACAISAVERLSKEPSTQHILVRNEGIMSALTKATFTADSEDETAMLMRTALKNLSAHL